MAQMRIFVSHSHQDNDWCRPFVEALKAVGYDVWYDETGLTGGDEWIDSIQREVENREVFLLILTPEAWDSKWVQREFKSAIRTDRRILPVKLRETQGSGFVLDYQWIAVVGAKPHDAARLVIHAIETPPAPGRNAAPQATTETLNDLKILCRSLATEGRYTESLSACERALSLDQNNIEVLRIKAWVLDKVGEHRLEGQTLHQILLLDPSDERLWSGQHNYPYKRIWDALDNEHDLLQAYSLLRSACPYPSWTNSLLWELLSGLHRINRLDAAMDLLVPLEDDSTRTGICKGLDRMGRFDLSERLLDGWYGHLRYSTGAAGMPLCQMLLEMHRRDRTARFLEVWYGYPPRLSALDDLPMLDIYAQTLEAVGRFDDGRNLRNSILRIFENRFGEALRWRFVKRAFVNYSSHVPPWSSATEHAAYKVYLATLEAVGRDDDARQLRLIYGGSY